MHLARAILLVCCGLLSQPEPQPQSAELIAIATRAKEAMSASRFDEAAGLYRDLLAKMPDEPGVLMNLGMALSMANRPQDAIEPLARAWTLRPSLLPAALFLGQSYMDTGKPAEAIDPLTTFVAAQPQHLQARQMLASALLFAGRHRDAAAEFARTTKMAPRDPRGFYGLVQAYDALAQESLDALEKSPEAAAYEPLLVADAFESEGKLEQAFAFYKRSLEKLPRLRSTHEALARIYTKTGHPDWAAQQTAKARAIPLACAAPAARSRGAGGASTTRSATGTSAKASGSSATAAGAQGAARASTPQTAECEFREGRYASVVSALAKRTDAEAAFWRARAYTELASAALAKLEAMPPSQELHELRAELYRNQRRHLLSVREMKAALAFAPDDPRLQRELAKSLYFARDWDAARAIIDSLLNSSPKDPELQFFYGDLLLQAQQAEAAVPHLQAAVDGDPSMPTAHASLGRALVQVGRFADAITHLEAVLAQDEDGSIHYQLARAYQGTSQPDRAKPLLEKYQALQRAAQARTQDVPPAITPPE